MSRCERPPPPGRIDRETQARPVAAPPPGVLQRTLCSWSVGPLPQSRARKPPPLPLAAPATFWARGGGTRAQTSPAGPGATTRGSLGWGAGGWHLVPLDHEGLDAAQGEVVRQRRCTARSKEVRRGQVANSACVTSRSERLSGHERKSLPSVERPERTAVQPGPGDDDALAWRRGSHRRGLAGWVRGPAGGPGPPPGGREQHDQRDHDEQHCPDGQSQTT